MTRQILYALLLLMSSAPALAKPPTILGWVEEVKIDGVDVTFKAKLDTGAKTSSIDAEVIDIRMKKPSALPKRALRAANRDEKGVAIPANHELNRRVVIKAVRKE